MVWDHIPQRTGFVVVSAATLDPERLRDCDLDVIYKIAVPNGLENAVSETEYQNVLHGLFAQVMIDTIDLFFLEKPEQITVQFLCRGKVVTKWFFENEASPVSVLLAPEAVTHDLLRDICE